MSIKSIPHEVVKCPLCELPFLKDRSEKTIDCPFCENDADNAYVSKRIRESYKKENGDEE